MSLVYICNSFILKYILDFFLLFDIYVFIRFKLVLGHLSGKIKELYMSGKTC